jgi:hypothetical protein
MVIDGYYIGGYWFLLTIINKWLLVAIILVNIGDY